MVNQTSPNVCLIPWRFLNGILHVAATTFKSQQIPNVLKTLYSYLDRAIIVFSGCYKCTHQILNNGTLDEYNTTQTNTSHFTTLMECNHMHIWGFIVCGSSDNHTRREAAIRKNCVWYHTTWNLHTSIHPPGSEVQKHLTQCLCILAWWPFTRNSILQQIIHPQQWQLMTLVSLNSG